MSDMVVVYELNSSPMVEVVMDMLREEGFHPALADDAGGVYHRMDKKDTGVEPPGPVKVRIVVPREEGAATRLFLQRREELADNRVAELTRELRRPMVLSALGTAVAFIVMASWCFPDPEELLLSLGLAVIAVFPASLILTANAVLARNTAGQICAVAITVAAVLGGLYCWDRALIWTGCCLYLVPVVGMVYIFLRTHKFVISHRRDNSYDMSDKSQDPGYGARDACEGGCPDDGHSEALDQRKTGDT